jgi:hypothetical protein
VQNSHLVLSLKGVFPAFLLGILATSEKQLRILDIFVLSNLCVLGDPRGTVMYSSVYRPAHSYGFIFLQDKRMSTLGDELGLSDI